MAASSLSGREPFNYSMAGGGVSCARLSQSLNHLEITDMLLLRPKLVLVALSVAIASFVSTHAVADDALPTPILPDTLRWIDAPGGLPAQAAWILGVESNPEPYLIRVKLQAGGRIPPHTHPDVRNSTVLSGTLYVGFGATFEEAKLVAIPAGAVYVGASPRSSFYCG